MKLKNYSYRLILFITTVLFLTTLGKNTGSQSLFKAKNADKYPSVFQLTDVDKEWIEKKISQMSLREKCAQMIIAPVYRSYMDTLSPDYDSTVALVRDHKIGGLIIFQGELKQVIKFTNDMQQLSDIPLLISADYENGLGMRIDDALEFPHAMALGATLNSNYAYEMGKAIAEECRLIGVYQDFAPVADINNNELNPVINIRSFSESKYTVSEFASSYMLGMKHGKVISTMKHFPGHGNTEIDSHTELPVIKGNRKQIMNNELYPFINAIEAGVQSIMIGHLEVPAFDTLPATLSKKIVTDLLKNTFRFDGLIITDAMNMEAINKYYSFKEATILAVEAGNDIILMPPDPAASIDTIYNAVLSGVLSKERIDYSVRKILSAKRWLKINRETNLNPQVIIDSLKNLHHKILADSIAANSITLLKNNAGVIPLNPLEYDKISCVTVTDGNGDETATYFSKMLEKRLGGIDSYLVMSKTGKRSYRDILSSVRNSDLILMPVFLDVLQENGKKKIQEEQIDFINKIIKLRAPVILISFKNPYLISALPNVRTYFNTYSYSRISQNTSLKAILGETDIRGKLPITIPKTKFVIGNGIEINKTLSTELAFDTSGIYNLTQADSLIAGLVKSKIIPDAVLSVGIKGKVIHLKVFGRTGKDSTSIKLDVNSSFNIGALTEPVGLTSAVMLLVEDGLLSPDDKVGYYLDGFNGEEKKDITIKNLLLHNSGFGREIDSLNINWSREDLLAAITRMPLKYKTGSREEHSRINDVLLQAIVEKISGAGLEEYLNNKLFRPLGMKHTFFKHTETKNERELFNKKFNYGAFLSQEEVLIYILKGVTGFTGLNSNASDLSIFSQMFLQKGYYAGFQYLSSNIVKNYTTPQLPDSYTSLGWETYISEPHISNKFSNSAYGLNSDKGSSIWIDPEKNLFIILLTDSNEETMKNYLPIIQDEIIERIEARVKELQNIKR